MVILASGSPRRQKLLRLIVPEYACVPARGGETVPEGTAWNDVPEFLARQKALEIAADHPDDLVIGADTVVVLDGEILGKPKDKSDAFRMLKALSGKRHLVLTGVAAAEKGGIRSFTQTTEVEFYPLSDELIRNYIATGEPMDKAGAYGIQ
nr:Maf family protein [Oscillospiraceae bacterium]